MFFSGFPKVFFLWGGKISIIGVVRTPVGSLSLDRIQQGGRAQKNSKLIIATSARTTPIIEISPLHKNQGWKGRTNLRKIPGHGPGVPGTPGGTNRALPADVPAISFTYCRKTDRKGHLCRDTGRVSQGHPAIQGFFRNFTWFFLMCLFCSLKKPVWKPTPSISKESLKRI